MRFCHLLMLSIQILTYGRNMGRFRTAAVVGPGNVSVSGAGHAGKNVAATSAVVKKRFISHLIDIVNCL